METEALEDQSGLTIAFVRLLTLGHGATMVVSPQKISAGSYFARMKSVDREMQSQISHRPFRANRPIWVIDSVDRFKHSHDTSNQRRLSSPRTAGAITRRRWRTGPPGRSGLWGKSNPTRQLRALLEGREEDHDAAADFRHDFLAILYDK